MSDRIFIGLGGNVGDVQANFIDAIERLVEHGINVVKESKIYEAEPIGVKDQDWFLNQVIEVETSLNPRELLHACLDIEKELGRVRYVERWGPHMIDLDILLYGDEEIHDLRFQLPHTEMLYRRFVMVPFCDIAPEVIHPVEKKTMGELLEILDRGDRSEVLPID